MLEKVNFTFMQRNQLKTAVAADIQNFGFTHHT